MTKPSRAHQYLAEKYSNIASEDTMTPHTYTPIQRFLLTLVLSEEDLLTNTAQTLAESLAQLKLSDNKMKLEHILDELNSNQLILAWAKEFLLKSSPEARHALTQSLHLHFPFNNASLKVIQLVINGIDL
ncbi:MAG: hypothetical protein C0582_02070 [Alphaproteobacteria bacterium]|nr:MAG: hypothetical protein C0582_02070 [Alphaproteobacteria bacterium]